jgi:hypothetical protein
LEKKGNGPRQPRRGFATDYYTHTLRPGLPTPPKFSTRGSRDGVILNPPNGD